ncbi:MAG: hypothetical protein HQM10_03805 [Candidatus Riflebacteria bacterium]|nr:hypothetical protein [Candidatus Riflebacteria bacterium]
MHATISEMGFKAVELHGELMNKHDYNEKLDDILQKIESFIGLCSRETRNANINAEYFMTIGRMLVESIENDIKKLKTNRGHTQ